MERELLALPFDGLELQNLCEVAKIELLNSKEITRELYENVVTQNKGFQIDSEKTIKHEKKKMRIISNYKIKLEKLRNPMNEKMNCCNNISDETGSSKWLIVILMREFNYVFNKQEF